MKFSNKVKEYLKILTEYLTLIKKSYIFYINKTFFRHFYITIMPLFIIFLFLLI